jgi:hypothetical protein
MAQNLPKRAADASDPRLRHDSAMVTLMNWSWESTTEVLDDAVLCAGLGKLAHPSDHCFAHDGLKILLLVIGVHHLVREWHKGELGSPRPHMLDPMTR